MTCHCMNPKCFKAGKCLGPILLVDDQIQRSKIVTLEFGEINGRMQVTTWTPTHGWGKEGEGEK